MSKTRRLPVQAAGHMRVTRKSRPSSIARWCSAKGIYNRPHHQPVNAGGSKHQCMSKEGPGYAVLANVPPNL